VPDLYVNVPDVWSESNTISPTLFMVLYFTFIPSTVSSVAESDVANSKTLAPTNDELGYVVVSSKLVCVSSHMPNNGCWFTPVFCCDSFHVVVARS